MYEFVWWVIFLVLGPVPCSLCDVVDCRECGRETKAAAGGICSECEDVLAMAAAAGK